MRTNSKDENLVEVNPGQFEKMSDTLIERSDGDKNIAGFFHCLGKAMGKEDNKVNSKFLSANQPNM